MLPHGYWLDPLAQYCVGDMNALLRDVRELVMTVEPLGLRLETEAPLGKVSLSNSAETL